MVLKPKELTAPIPTANTEELKELEKKINEWLKRQPKGLQVYKHILPTNIHPLTLEAITKIYIEAGWNAKIQYEIYPPLSGIERTSLVLRRKGDPS
jgi:hypothetical protein